MSKKYTKIFWRKKFDCQSIWTKSKDGKYEKYAFNIKLRNIIEEEENINMELFQKYFNASLMLKVLKNVEDKEKNHDFVSLIKSSLTEFTDNIKWISEDEKRIEQSDRKVDIIEEIIDFNEQNKD